MAEYQKVELVTGGESPAFSEEDIQKIEEETKEASETPEAPEERSEERPEWLPEKFGSPQELAKAYSELETAYSKRDTEKGDGGSEEASTVSKSISPESLNEFNSEFSQTGDVSEESRQKIVDMGIPREFVDAYVEGQKAVMTNHFNTIYNEVGGEEAYKSMVEWATENLTEGDQEAFNKAVVTGTTDEMMFAIKGLNTQWRNSTADAPPLIQGDTSSGTGGGSYRSLAELTAAMKDPRYGNDPAYRKDVENRLANSDIM